MQTEPTLVSPYVISKGTDSPLEIRTALIAFVIMAILLISDMLTGPLRYYLSHLGLSFIIYLPKVACLFFVIHALVRKPIDRPLFYILLLLFIYAGIGFIHQVGLKSQLFTLYLIAPFLFGAVAARYLHEMEGAFVALMAIVFMITALGVSLDVFIDFPWKGFVDRVAETEIEGSREWTTMGFERVAGFARMSAVTAFYLVCSALFLYSYSRSKWFKLLVVLVAFPTVIATTNKAGIGGLVLGIASIVLVSFPRVLKLFVYGLATTVMLLPISTVIRTYDLNLSDPVSLLLLASFEDRLINGWPNFIAAVSKFGNPFTGVGFGGVGTAIKYFAKGSREILAVGDNFAVYLYGSFGLVAIVLILYFARVAVRLFASKDRLTRSLAPVMVALLAAALTTDIIEAQVFAFILGIAVALSSMKPCQSSDAIGETI